ncbi:unnamed protein product, partial [Polarella glacialis]
GSRLDAPVDREERGFRRGEERGSGSGFGFGREERGFGGFGRARHGPRGDFPLDERISHCLGRILRYRAGEYRLQPDKDGFVPVSELLALPELRGGTLEDVRRVASESVGSRGQRFEIQDTLDPATGSTATEVRARYRHDKESCPGRFDGGRNGFSGDRGFGRRGDAQRGFGRGGAVSRGYGFSRPLDEGEEPTMEASSGSKPASTKPASPTLFKMSPRSSCKEGDRFDIEDQFAALGPGRGGVLAGAAVLEAEEGKSPKTLGASSAASASTVDSTSALQEEVWERFLEPGTGRVWFWNEATEEVLREDDPEPGWQQFFTDSGQRWWCHEDSGRYFLEDIEEGQS